VDEILRTHVNPCRRRRLLEPGTARSLQRTAVEQLRTARARVENQDLVVGSQVLAGKRPERASLTGNACALLRTVRANEREMSHIGTELLR
jgi:hypothetical protein